MALSSVQPPFECPSDPELNMFINEAQARNCDYLIVMFSLVSLQHYPIYCKDESEFEENRPKSDDRLICTQIFTRLELYGETGEDVSLPPIHEEIEKMQLATVGDPWGWDKALVPTV